MPTFVGGAFGGKISHLVEPVCALLAQKSGRPVKIALTMNEEFSDSHPGPACSISLKTGAKRDGRLMSMQGEVIWDTGAAPGAMPGFFARCQGLYKIKNQSFDIYSVYTNKLIPGAYRAPGALQIAFAVESQIDIIASKLGLDPLQMRLKNAVAEGDIGVDGKPYPKIGLKKCLQEIEKMVRRNDPAGRPYPYMSDSKRRGWGIACGKWINGIGASAVSLSLNEDGSLKLLTGCVDLTGVNTAFAQIVSAEFQVPLEKVTVVTGDTDTAAYVAGTGGSRTTYAMGNAIIKAALELKTKMFQLASDRLEANVEDLELKAGKILVRGSPEKVVTFAELGAASVWSKGGPLIANGSLSNPTWLSNDPAFVVQAAQVEVDTETGEVKVLRFISAQDVGLAINLLLVEGQIQGACSQGIGWGLTEDYVFNAGKPVNKSYRDYWIPRAYDLPMIEAIIVEVPSVDGPYGARGVGEPAMIPAPAAIANAVYDAVGVRIKELPIMPDKVFKALMVNSSLHFERRH